jgi:hypothetical protein
VSAGEAPVQGGAERWKDYPIGTTTPFYYFYAIHVMDFFNRDGISLFQATVVTRNANSVPN